MFLVEAVVLVTRATLKDAAELARAVEDRSGGRVVLAGLVERGDGLPRLDASVERADPARATSGELASYARRRIA